MEPRSHQHHLRHLSEFHFILHFLRPKTNATMSVNYFLLLRLLQNCHNYPKCMRQRPINQISRFLIPIHDHYLFRHLRVDLGCRIQSLTNAPPGMAHIPPLLNRLGLYLLPVAAEREGVLICRQSYKAPHSRNLVVPP
jgi:hypothetical protein